MAIRALIVDDEPLARLNLSTLLADEADFDVVGEFADAPSAIAALRAAANYVTLHVGAQAWDVREKIGDIALRLPPGRFLRIHRSYIVNVAALLAIQPSGGGEYIATLRSGRELPVGASYPAAIREAL